MPTIEHSLRSFNAAIDRAVREAPEKLVTIQKRIALDLLSRVVLKTPVDTGRARGNWHLTIGEPATEVRERGPGVRKESGAPLGDPGVADTMVSRGERALASLPPYQIVWLSNAVEYIGYLEEGRPGPGSPQAANGMLAVSLEELSHHYGGRG